MLDEGGEYQLLFTVCCLMLTKVPILSELVKERLVFELVCTRTAVPIQNRAQ